MSESHIKNIDGVNDIKSTMIGKNKKILEFGASDDSAAKIFKRDKCTIRQFGLDSGNIDSLNTKKLFGNEKFDVIIIDKILESLENPTKILQQLQNLLENNGFFVCVVPNFLFAPNRINFLNGNLDFQRSSTNLGLYTLDTFLLLLDNANLKITQVNRIKQKSNVFSNSTLNYLTYSNNLIDAILQDPESDTISYVLKVEPGQIVPAKIRQYILETFPKNIASDGLNSKNEFTKKSIDAKDEMIGGLETTISDKDKFLEKVISDKDKFLEKVISAKDEMIGGLETTINDKDKFLEKVISAKDEMIAGLERSIDENLAHYEHVKKSKDEMIAGLERSIAENKLDIKKIKSGKAWKVLKKLDSFRKDA
jgi:hypothetical protein